MVAIIQAGARALADKHITVNGFSPGVVDTPLWTQLDKDMVAINAAENEGDAFAAFASEHCSDAPHGLRTSSPAVFLASADSDFITGQVMAIDGGMVLCRSPFGDSSRQLPGQRGRGSGAEDSLEGSKYGQALHHGQSHDARRRAQ